MRVENFAGIIQGKILSKHAISDIDGFYFDKSEVKNAGAFFCFSRRLQDAKDAVVNGAYAVICDVNLGLDDDEIAVIEVENLDKSLVRLMRFFASEKKLEFVEISGFQREILEGLNLPKNALLARANLIEFFWQIYGAESEKIVFCQDADEFSTKFKKIRAKKAHLGEFSSMFFCDYDGLNLQFPVVFLEQILGVKEFFKSCDLAFKVRDFRDFAHFRAIFVDRFLRPVKFGASARAFIVESDANLLQAECDFLAEFSDDYAICLPRGHDFKGLNCSKVKYFDDFSELRAIKFKYALVFCEFDDLFSFLSQEMPQETLFEC